MTKPEVVAGTKERLLDVAEQLVAERGFDAVSLRQVTEAAEANLASVNYHFGSREGLINAVIERRVGPINRERLQLLDDLEARTERGETELTLEAVLEALFKPVVTIYRNSQRRREVFFRFMGRCMGETDERRTEFMAEQFREVVDRFTAAFSRALPGVAPAEIHLQFLFSVGVMAHTLCFIGQLSKFTGTEGVHLSLEQLTSKMVDFAAAGFRASAREAVEVEG